MHFLCSAPIVDTAKAWVQLLRRCCVIMNQRYVAATCCATGPRLTDTPTACIWFLSTTAPALRLQHAHHIRTGIPGPPGGHLCAGARDGTEDARGLDVVRECGA